MIPLVVRYLVHRRNQKLGFAQSIYDNAFASTGNQNVAAALTAIARQESDFNWKGDNNNQGGGNHGIFNVSTGVWNQWIRQGVNVRDPGAQTAAYLHQLQTNAPQTYQQITQAQSPASVMSAIQANSNFHFGTYSSNQRVQDRVLNNAQAFQNRFSQGTPNMPPAPTPAPVAAAPAPTPVPTPVPPLPTPAPGAGLAQEQRNLGQGNLPFPSPTPNQVVDTGNLPFPTPGPTPLPDQLISQGIPFNAPPTFQPQFQGGGISVPSPTPTQNTQFADVTGAVPPGQMPAQSAGNMASIPFNPEAGMPIGAQTLGPADIPLQIADLSQPSISYPNFSQSTPNNFFNQVMTPPSSFDYMGGVGQAALPYYTPSTVSDPGSMSSNPAVEAYLSGNALAPYGIGFDPGSPNLAQYAGMQFDESPVPDWNASSLTANQGGTDIAQFGSDTSLGGTLDSATNALLGVPGTDSEIPAPEGWVNGLPPLTQPQAIPDVPAPQPQAPTQQAANQSGSFGGSDYVGPPPDALQPGTVAGFGTGVYGSVGGPFSSPGFAGPQFHSTGIASSPYVVPGNPYSGMATMGLGVSEALGMQTGGFMPVGTSAPEGHMAYSSLGEGGNNAKLAAYAAKLGLTVDDLTGMNLGLAPALNPYGTYKWPGEVAGSVSDPTAASLSKTGVKGKARGGIVAPHLPDYGVDTVPAMLRPKEIVFTPEQIRGIKIRNRKLLRKDQIHAIERAA